MNIHDELFKLIDNKYKSFNSKLIPSVDKDTILGVRIPELRKLVKKMSEDDKISFINTLPHKYHEEYIMHSIILCDYKNIDLLFKDLELFLPYINSWDVTDTLKPNIFKKNIDTLYNKILMWINSEHEYIVRYALVCLLTYFVDDEFNEETLYIVSKINREEYYINIAIAWYYSFTLIKQYDSAIKIFENKILNKWIHNKSIQKAIESYRISDERKEYLKSLRIK